MYDWEILSSPENLESIKEKLIENKLKGFTEEEFYNPPHPVNLLNNKNFDPELFESLKKAKEIMIANMAEPPRLEALAEQVGLSLKKLKMGFKQIYGDTVFGFLFDYKMDYARQLLDSGSYNVNEVGLKIGYSTGSHFIAAFKKKFGTTPKKYLMNLNTNV